MPIQLPHATDRRPGVHNLRPLIKMYAAVNMEFKMHCKFWRPCINKYSLSTLGEYLVKRRTNRRVVAG